MICNDIGTAAFRAFYYVVKEKCYVMHNDRHVPVSLLSPSLLLLYLSSSSCLFLFPSFLYFSLA